MQALVLVRPKLKFISVAYLQAEYGCSHATIRCLAACSRFLQVLNSAYLDPVTVEPADRTLCVPLISALMSFGMSKIPCTIRHNRQQLSGYTTAAMASNAVVCPLDCFLLLCLVPLSTLR